MQKNQFCFAESYLQEAIVKITLLNKHKIEWHFVGQIQKKKCKAIAENFHWVQSLDRIDIAEKLNNHCQSLNKELNILIQINPLQEEHKAGLHMNRVESFLQQIKHFKHLKIRGLMTIPKLEKNQHLRRLVFAKVFDCYQRYKDAYSFDTLSMGMSQDYLDAILAGSNMIRLGTALFGERIEPSV